MSAETVKVPKKQRSCFKKSKKPFSYWQNVVFTEGSRVQLSSDWVVCVFRKKNEKVMGNYYRKTVAGRRFLIVEYCEIR